MCQRFAQDAFREAEQYEGHQKPFVLPVTHEVCRYVRKTHAATPASWLPRQPIAAPQLFSIPVNIASIIVDSQLWGLNRENSIVPWL